MSRYVEIAVHLPVPGTFLYSVPERLRERELLGYRTLVPFGNRGVTGVVVGVADEPGAIDGRIRELDGLLDAEPLVTPELIDLCRWIADYYQAPFGEVLRAALPAGTSVTATWRVSLTERGRQALQGEGGALPRKTLQLLARLADEEGAGKRSGRPGQYGELVEAGLAVVDYREKRARVREKTARVAALVRELCEEDWARLARAPARTAVLRSLVDAGGRADVAALSARHKNAAQHLRALEHAELVRFEERSERAAVAAVPDSDDGFEVSATPLVLNDEQSAAASRMVATLSQREYAGYLLHGITGSGKTEVYLHVIARCLEQGRTAIVLVPEISLTPQLAARFRARFGPQVAVLHSGLGDRERFDEWRRLHTGEARIALGARSAVFAPVRELGAVVVDEEHDSSFKQEEGVRYQARDVALVRAKRAGAVCVLGSATPSLESYHGAQSGRLELIELSGRATGMPLPEVEVVDLRRHRPEQSSMLTAPLAEAVAETLAAGDQAILFLNRRGFDTFVTCTGCGHAFRCASCSVSLTYHRGRDRLLCHYCGHGQALARRCPECGSESIARRGFGTEKIAEAVADRFPQARVDRLDRDVGGGHAVQKVLGRVGRREVDILVGTQMVTKGHDFAGVTLVGVLCADTGLSLPDFRASERTFQLLTQVAGRSGRGQRGGRVIVQTYRPDALAISAAQRHDYRSFYGGETESRMELDYPPYGHLVAIRIDGPDAGAVAARARSLAQRAREYATLRGGPGVAVLGPTEAPLARLKGRTRWHLWLRARARRPLRELVHATIGDGSQPAGVRTTVDVDPVSAL